jgi:hypothetical protein
MKKVVVALAAVVLLGIALLLGVRGSGFELFGVHWAWNEDAEELRQLAYSFLEDIQYKDFDQAASYHTWEDQWQADIPRLIERLFAVKPEQLNVRDIAITQVTLDRAGRRARTFFEATVELLSSAHNQEEENRERRVEGVLYWHQRPAAESWPTTDELAAGADQQPRKTRRDPPPVPAGNPPRGGEQRWFLMLESSLR